MKMSLLILICWPVGFWQTYGQVDPLVQLLSQYAVEFQTDSGWIEIDHIYPYYMDVETKCVYDVTHWQLYAYLPLEKPSFESFIKWLKNRGRQ